MRKFPVRLLLSAIGVAFLAACGNVTCDEDHPSVALARNIPQKDWARLFSEAEAVARAQPLDFGNASVKTPLPKFDISPLTFKGYSEHASVKLAGCFDHGAYLSLDELNTPQGKIELSWGEGPESGSQILWSRSPAP